MKNPLVLTIDLGTQSVRSSLYNKKGDTVAFEKITFEPAFYSKEPGWAEQNPDFYFEKVKLSVKNLMEKVGDLKNDIIAFSMTTIRDSVVFLDKYNKPLRDVILWLDQRRVQPKEKIPFIYRAIYRLADMTDTANFNRQRTMGLWVKEYEPKIWGKTKKYVNISTYLTYLLIGRLADSPSQCVGHFPLHYRKRKWYNDHALKGVIYGLPKCMMPELVHSGEVVGTIKAELAKELGLPENLKMIASGSDKGCETVGLGALSPTIASLSFGTGSTIEISNKKYIEPEKFLPSYPAAVPGFFNMEVLIYRGFWMTNWFVEQFGAKYKEEAKQANMTVENYLNSKLHLIKPGCEGLALQPYWGPGLARPLSRGSIVGFNERHTNLHVYRAIIEGIMYALRDSMIRIEHKQHQKVQKVMVAGGGAQSDEVCQITADVFGLPVYRAQTCETSSLGCAIVTFTGAGEFASYEEAISMMSHPSEPFMPNKETHKIYDKNFFEIYMKLYPKLKNVYKKCTKYGK